MDIDRLLRLHSDQTHRSGKLHLRPGRHHRLVQSHGGAHVRLCAAGPDRPAGPSPFTAEDIQEGVPDFELCVARESSDMNNDRWLQRADGSRFWASGSTTALRDEKGEVIAYGKTLRNRST